MAAKITRNRTITVTISPPKELVPLIEARRKALHLSRTAYWVRLASLDLGLSRDLLPPVTAEELAAFREGAQRLLPGGIPHALNEEAPVYGAKKKGKEKG